MARAFGENLQTDTGSFGQSGGSQKFLSEGKRVKWAAPFLLRLPGIVEITASTSISPPEFLVQEQRVWQDRCVPGPVEISPLNPVRTKSINIENVEGGKFETYPRLPTAARAPEPVAPAPRRAPTPPTRYRIVDTNAFRELLRQFEKADRDGNNQIDQVEFVRIVDSLGLSGLTAREIQAAFSSFDTDGNGTIDFSEFFSKFKNEYVQDPFDSINNNIRDAILRASGNFTSKDRFPRRRIPDEIKVRGTIDFKDLERSFERKGPRGRVTFFDFQDILNDRSSRVSTNRLQRAFNRMKIPNTDYIFYDEFLNNVGRRSCATRNDDIGRYIVDAIFDLAA